MSKRVAIKKNCKHANVMGAGNSQIEDFIPPFVNQILSDEPVNTLISGEIHRLTYEQFLGIMGELNSLSKENLDSNGKQLVFAVKKDTDSTVFWKATVQIACVKVDPQTHKVESFRLLTLSEFLKVFKTLKCQVSAVEHSKSDSPLSGLTVSTILNSVNDTGGGAPNECCICLERQQEVILPCAHSFCTKCIEEWNESHDTCPICREILESTDDTWLLSEVPKADEISQEIRENLSELTQERSPPCSPS